MTQTNFTYNDLIVRYGRDMAFDILISIEKLARIKNSIDEFDENVRLQRALAELDKSAA